MSVIVEQLALAQFAGVDPQKLRHATAIFSGRATSNLISALELTPPEGQAYAITKIEVFAFPLDEADIPVVGAWRPDVVNEPYRFLVSENNWGGSLGRGFFNNIPATENHYLHTGEVLHVLGANRKAFLNFSAIIEAPAVGEHSMWFSMRISGFLVPPEVGTLLARYNTRALVQ